MPETPRRLLTYEDIDRIASKCDPTSVYRCTCGGVHYHTESCLNINAKRIEEHHRHAADIIRGDEG